MWRLNRRGFYQKAEAYIKNPKNYGKHIILIYADLNYLKQINDRFGHSEGNFAIKACADALDKVLPKGIAGRIGGDEFAALTICNNESDEYDFRESINKYLARINNISSKLYKITVSLGIWKSFLHDGFELDHAIEMADALLYEDKKNKKSFVIKNSN